MAIVGFVHVALFTREELPKAIGDEGYPFVVVTYFCNGQVDDVIGFFDFESAFAALWSEVVR